VVSEYNCFKARYTLQLVSEVGSKLDPGFKAILEQLNKLSAGQNKM
jgi:hypothetical protein